MAQSLNAYTVVAGIQIVTVELDPLNLIPEINKADNIGVYAWASHGAVSDIGITGVTLSPSSLSVPLHGDSVVLNVALTGSGIPSAGMITLIAVLDDYSTEVFCGALDISGSTFSGGTATVSVTCTTENARVGIAYLPVVRVTALGFVDSVSSNNEGYGDHYIIPQSMPPGNVRIISGSLPLAEVNIYTTSGSYVTTAWPLSDGTVFLNLSTGTYLMYVETTIGAPLFDANGYPAFAIAANPTSDTAPTVSLDKNRYTCAPGYCMQLTVGSQTSFLGWLMRMASVAMAAVSSDEEQAMRDRLAWEAAYAMVGCKSGLPNTPKDKGGDCSNVSKYIAEVFNTATSETKQLPSIYSYLNSDAGAAQKAFAAYGTAGTCYGNYSPCWIQDSPLTDLVKYSQKEGMPDADDQVYQGGLPRGGQCKIFVNILLYRSGIYQGPAPDYNFKMLPPDSVTDWVKKDADGNWIPAPEEETKYPAVDGATLRVGTVLRKPDIPNVTDDVPHAVIALARIEPKDGKPLSVLVTDSNWIWPGHTGGGNGHEIIGTHVMTINQLIDNVHDPAIPYRVLDCVYDDSPC